MGTGSDRAARLSAAVRGVVEAGNLDEALRRLIGPFREEFALRRSSVLVFLPTDRVRIVATWGTGETLLPLGSEIAVNLTKGTGELSARLVAGEAVVIAVSQADLGMLEDVARDEGVRSIVLLPLFGPMGLSAVLTMSSSRDAAFTAEDTRLLAGIAAGVGNALTALLDASGRAEV